MKIVKLKAENFKRLVAVEIKPDGNTVILTGKNGAGKSSVLDAIVAGLCGKKQVPQMPIRKGQKKATVEIELDTMTIKRVFTDAGSRLEITNKKGFKAPNPQAMLDDMVGAISFDPLAFQRSPAREQRATLMGLVGLDTDDLDEKIQQLKINRSGLLKEKDRLRFEADAIELPDDLPIKAVSVASLLDQQQKAIKHNQKEDAAEDLRDELQEELKGWEVQADEANERVLRLTEEIKALPSPAARVDVEAINRQLANAEEVNRQIDAAASQKELEGKAESAAEEYAKAGKAMKSLEQEKADRLAAVTMPVEGLGVNGESVTFNDVPFDQVNTSKAYEVGVAISMALNPTLRVIRMSGNDLDGDTLKAISKMVDDKDYQVWIEKVDETGKIGIVIEDGMIVK